MNKRIIPILIILLFLSSSFIGMSNTVKTMDSTDSELMDINRIYSAYTVETNGETEILELQKTSLSTSDGVEIYIFADRTTYPDDPLGPGVGRSIWIYVINNRKEPIRVYYQIDYCSLLLNYPLDTYQWKGYFDHQANSSYPTVFSNGVPVPCHLIVTVQSSDVYVSRYGFQFLRWIYFPREESGENDYINRFNQGNQQNLYSGIPRRQHQIEIEKEQI